LEGLCKASPRGGKEKEKIVNIYACPDLSFYVIVSLVFTNILNIVNPGETKAEKPKYYLKVTSQ
jgi:hypothetical protein